MPPFAPPHILCLIVVTAASICDLKTKKIPNLLTFPAAALGIALNFYLSGAQGALWSASGWLVGAAIVIASKIALRQIGFGDAKLIAAVGAILGPKLVLAVYFYFCLCFGLFATASIVTAIPWRQIWQAAMAGQAESTKYDLVGLHKALKNPVPLAPMIAVAAAITIVFGQQTLNLIGF